MRSGKGSTRGSQSRSSQAASSPEAARLPQLPSQSLRTEAAVAAAQRLQQRATQVAQGTSAGAGAGAAPPAEAQPAEAAQSASAAEQVARLRLPVREQAQAAAAASPSPSAWPACAAARSPPTGGAASARRSPSRASAPPRRCAPWPRARRTCLLVSLRTPRSRGRQSSKAQVAQQVWVQQQQQPRRPRPRPARHAPLLGRPEPSAPRCFLFRCSATMPDCCQAAEGGWWRARAASPSRPGTCDGTAYGRSRGPSPSATSAGAAAPPLPLPPWAVTRPPCVDASGTGARRRPSRRSTPRVASRGCWLPWSWRACCSGETGPPSRTASSARRKRPRSSAMPQSMKSM